MYKKNKNKKNILFFNQNTIVSDIIMKMQEIAIITDDFERIVGIFTEGDFRKSVLKNIDTNISIKKIMNKKFFFVSPSAKKNSILNIFKKVNIQKILITKNKKYKGIIDRDEFFENITNDKFLLDNPVIIMSGGLGKRLAPLTRILPKGLIPVGNEPIIKMIMNEFYKNSFNNFNIILNYHGKMFEGYFFQHKLKFNINFFHEKNRLGTVGYLSKLKKNFNKTIFLTNCDILLKVNYKEILKYHENLDNDLTICSSYKKIKIPYGVCNINKKSQLISMQEKPEVNYLVNTGFYLIKPNVLKYLSYNQKTDMNEFITKLKKLKKKIGVYPVPGNSWLDMGEWNEYQKTINLLK